jgi:hypothetical protein
MLVIVQSSEGAFDHARQLVGGSVNGLVDGGGVRSHGKRLIVGKTSLEQAALVALSSLVTFCWPVFVAQMYFNAREVIAEVAQSVFHDTSHVCRQRFMTGNMVIGIDLYLHALLQVLVRAQGPADGREGVSSAAVDGMIATAVLSQGSIDGAQLS